MSLKQAIALLDDERVELVEKALRNAGWTRHCDSPGSMWYWVREWKGKHWTLWTTDSAYAMQRTIDSWAKLEGNP